MQQPQAEIGAPEPLDFPQEDTAAAFTQPENFDQGETMTE
jgi:hypothetical protein